jgi:hypothetical protein
MCSQFRTEPIHFGLQFQDRADRREMSRTQCAQCFDLPQHAERSAVKTPSRLHRISAARDQSIFAADDNGAARQSEHPRSGVNLHGVLRGGSVRSNLPALDQQLTAIPPHSPTPVRVLTVSGAAGAKANSLQSVPCSSSLQSVVSCWFSLVAIVKSHPRRLVAFFPVATSAL